MKIGRNIDPVLDAVSLSAHVACSTYCKQFWAALCAHFDVDGPLRKVGSENDYIYCAVNDKIY